jgi:hypothetical protein
MVEFGFYFRRGKRVSVWVQQRQMARQYESLTVDKYELLEF